MTVPGMVPSRNDKMRHGRQICQNQLFRSRFVQNNTQRMIRMLDSQAIQQRFKVGFTVGEEVVIHGVRHSAICNWTANCFRAQRILALFECCYFCSDLWRSN
jgi:hypothetical protein